jgi:type IV pilus assembly protein PilE
MTTRSHSASCHGSAGRAGGFTLIELMVVIVIGAILMSIAIPSWQTQIRKSRRTDAKNAILDMAGREERYLSTTNSYSALPSDLGYAAGTAWPQVIGSGYYQISIPAATVVPAAAGPPATPASYIIVVDAINTQTKDTQCAHFMLTQTGQQSSQDSSGVVTTGTNSVCWN